MKEPRASRDSYEIESRVEAFHWWFAGRRALLRSILASLSFPSPCLCLDIGCGVGSNLATITTSGTTVVGVDREFLALELARKTSPFSLINGDLTHLPVRPESVGLIVAMDVLEHLEDDTKGIHSIHQALKKEGHLILTVPAFHFLWGIQDEVTGHWRRYSRKEILDRVREGGFEIVRSSYFNFFLFVPILLARRLFRFLRLKIRSENEVNSPWINGVLKSVFSIEPCLLRVISFPVGASIFCVARKP